MFLILIYFVSKKVFNQVVTAQGSCSFSFWRTSALRGPRYGPFFVKIIVQLKESFHSNIKKWYLKLDNIG